MATAAIEGREVLRGGSAPLGRRGTQMYLERLQALGLANAVHYTAVLKHCRRTSEAAALLDQMRSAGLTIDAPVYLAVHEAWMRR